MHEVLYGKKVIFFDVGYTLDYPLSGDWILTNKFYELAGKQFNSYMEELRTEVLCHCIENLLRNHKVQDMKEEFLQFYNFYKELNQELGLELTPEDIRSIAYDRTYNMDNYVPYPDAKAVVEELRRSYILGIISDTWPSIEPQLEAIGVNPFFAFRTYSFALGVLKPDKRMYLDALEKCGCSARDTVFIDDSVENLKGAAEYGIAPILIAANPASDIDTEYCKIHSLSELLR